MSQTVIEEKKITSVCYHCGIKTRRPIVHDDLQFCCLGCKNVYELLSKNNLCKYYDLNENPGNNVQEKVDNYAKFNFLEEEKIVMPLLEFDGDEIRKLTFYLPQIHCSSCLYLLENLHRINPDISSARLNFTKKELSVSYKKNQITAKQIAILLSKLGYEPYFSLSHVTNSKNKKNVLGEKRLYRLGIAAFSFSNIMLMSFPEYFDWGSGVNGLGKYFQWFSFVLTLPVISYSAQEFYSIAWGGLKKKYLTIDLPIVLALCITFGRSLYEIITGNGPGYFDSLTGIVFFMLLGRYFQDKTYENLSFSRDYASYFPLSAHVWRFGKVNEIPISEIQIGDDLIIHNQEIIVTDGRLASGSAIIDYSFVTGESKPIVVEIGEWVYAGGRQLGSSIRVIAEKQVAQGYLVSLWNQSAKSKESPDDVLPKESNENVYIHSASQWFTVGLFIVAISASIYWSFRDPSQMWHVLTSVLIVACPCALLLSVTFTNGHILSVLARYGLYLRSATSLENWRKIDAVIFDKTGTLTDTKNPEIFYSGNTLTENQMEMIASVAKESIHPLARAVSKFLDRAHVPINSIENISGKGILGKCESIEIRLGSRSFVGLSDLLQVGVKGKIEEVINPLGSEIWVKIDNEIMGRFTVMSRYRKGLNRMLESLKKTVMLIVLSGDNSSEKSDLENFLPTLTTVHFDVKPHEKKEYIAQLQLFKKKVLMVGDGLNDVAALKQADFSIAVTENVGYFTPSSDAILLGESLKHLDRLWKLAKRAKTIIWWSFAISLVYNVVGLSFAISGKLNPLIAAILMPASSISIVVFTYIASNWGFWEKGDKNHTGR